MTKTENYQLNQWDPTDKISREDFNSDNAVIDGALAALAVPGFVVGSYTGNGVAMEDGGMTVDVGFRPRFLIIGKGWSATNSLPTTMYIAGEHLHDVAANVFAWTDTGFKVGLYGTSSYVSRLNTDGVTYGFIAFR